MRRDLPELSLIAAARARGVITPSVNRRLTAGNRVALGPRCAFRIHRQGVVTLGERVSIRSDLDCWVSGELDIGDDVFLNRWCSISVMESVRIGPRVRLGERVSIHDENHERPPSAGYVTAPVIIGADAWLGAGVIVLPGVEIGERAVIGAGSVVTHSVASGAVVVGVPARPIRGHG